jgi:hypothetical protein
VDQIALLVYAARVQEKALNIAADARDLGNTIQGAGLVDEAMLIRRAQTLDGLAQMRREDLTVLRHPLLIGRWCEAGARVLLAIARALR